MNWLDPRSQFRQATKTTKELSFSGNPAERFRAPNAFQSKIELLHFGKPALVFVGQKFQVAMNCVDPTTACHHKDQFALPGMGLAVIDCSRVPQHESCCDRSAPKAESSARSAGPCGRCKYPSSARNSSPVRRKPADSPHRAY